MAKKKLFDKEDVASVRAHLQALQEMPPPRHKANVREVIADVRQLILTLRKKGWEWPVIAEELKKVGVQIAPASLKQYATRRKRKDSNTGKARNYQA